MTNCFACNKLSLNSSKRETISFGIGKPPALKIDNISIPDKPHYKGFHLDPRLSFREHISKKIEQILRTDVQSQVYVPEEMSQLFIIIMLKLSSVMVY